MEKKIIDNEIVNFLFDIVSFHDGKVEMTKRSIKVFFKNKYGMYISKNEVTGEYNIAVLNRDGEIIYNNPVMKECVRCKGNDVAEYIRIIATLPTRTF